MEENKNRGPLFWRVAKIQKDWWRNDHSVAWDARGESQRCACVLRCLSRVQLFVTLWTVALQMPLSMEFSRQEYWRVLPCPPPGDLPDSGIEPTSLKSPALANVFFATSATWEAPIRESHYKAALGTVGSARAGGEHNSSSWGFPEKGQLPAQPSVRNLPGRGSVRVLGPEREAVQKRRHSQLFCQIQSGRRDRRGGDAQDGNTLNRVPPRGKPSQLEQLPRTPQLPASFSYAHYREGCSSTHLPAYKSTRSFIHLFTHSLRKDYVSGFCFVLGVEKTKIPVLGSL